MQNILKLKLFSSLKGDIFGAIIASIIAFPQALAFGVASGMGASAGIWGAIILSLFAGVLGCNLPFVSGPTGPVAIITATVVAFTINYACYFSVIFRGGIEGIPAGQREAGQVLGMTRSQIFFKITLLQMVKRVVPPMSNEIITLVKDTSLARIIAAYELTFAGYSFMKSAGLTWPLFYTGVFYLIFIGILTLLFNYIEKKLDYFK